MFLRQVLFREDCGADELIDVIEGNRKYIRCLYVYNKIDVMSIEEVDEVARRPHAVPISCSMNLGLAGKKFISAATSHPLLSS